MTELGSLGCSLYLYFFVLNPCSPSRVALDVAMWLSGGDGSRRPEADGAAVAPHKHIVALCQEMLPQNAASNVQGLRTR